ncbi:MAG: glycosyltransferase, partial [Pseudomonadota bacterium]|nr:glycosyltransferase [Pseudomonadota bacterium]
MWVVFLVSAAAIFYAYAGFPLLLAAAAAVMRKTVRQGPIRPRVSILVAAYNEQNSIGRRLDNLLATDYPRELLDILVVSDGSTDRTNAIVRRYQDRGVRLLALPRMGKNLAIREAVAHCQGEILVFSDANTAFAPQAVQRLVRNFADPQVGG